MGESNDEDEMACEVHGIETLPSGYDHCPICREVRRHLLLMRKYGEQEIVKSGSLTMRSVTSLG